jgi:hypothetical protein
MIIHFVLPPKIRTLKYTFPTSKNKAAFKWIIRKPIKWNSPSVLKIVLRLIGDGLQGLPQAAAFIVSKRRPMMRWAFNHGTIQDRWRIMVCRKSVWVLFFGEIFISQCTFPCYFFIDISLLVLAAIFVICHLDDQVVGNFTRHLCLLNEHCVKFRVPKYSTKNKT